MVAAAAGGGSGSLSVTCSFCEFTGHCVDKCTKRMKILADGREKLLAERKKQRKRGGKKGGKGGGDSSEDGGDEGGGGDDKKEHETAGKPRERACWEFQKSGSCSKTGCRYQHTASGTAGSATAPRTALAAPPQPPPAFATITLEDAQAIALLMERAEGNDALQRAIADRVDQGWEH
jgi:hypothetical protein